MVTFDSRDAGTSVETWGQDARRASLPRLSLDDVTGLVVVAAHPDDETLGAGGLIASARARGLPVTVVVVTDGAAGGEAPDPSGAGLAEIRATEASAAMAALDVSDLRLLGFADGGVREERDAVAQRVRALLDEFPTRLLVAPWTGDGHRDHRVVGEIAAAAAATRGIRLWSYPIWLWHWASPSDSIVPWSNLGACTLTPKARAAKASAIECYPSQTTGTVPVLHQRFLRHFDGVDEPYVVVSAVRQQTPQAIESAHTAQSPVTSPGADRRTHRYLLRQPAPPRP